MVNGPNDARMLRDELVCDRPGGVARAIVDDDDLEGLCQPRQRLEGLVDQPAQVGLLVVGREEVRQSGDPLRHGPTSTMLRDVTRKTFGANGDFSGVSLYRVCSRPSSRLSIRIA